MSYRNVVLAGALCLAGCDTMEGPRGVIGADGVPPPAAGPNTNASLVEDFRAKAAAAAAGGATAGDANDFMRSGFALVYANCADYFWKQGQNQTNARVGRDLVAPFVTLLTGAIALKNFTDSGSRDRLLSAVSLSSAFTTAGLDAYDRHFLFGAENIDSVRELTSKALVKHASEAHRLGAGTFQQAVIHLIDNQAICTPSHILSLSREAIAKGVVEGRATGTPQERQDRDIQRSLGALINPPSSLSDEQMFGLWWLYEGAPGADRSGEGDYADIHTLLSDLPEQVNPISKTETTAADGSKTLSFAYKAWAHEAEVRRALRNLSPTRVAQFRQELDRQEDDEKAGISSFAQVESIRARLRRMPAEDANDGIQRIGISIRDD